MKLYEDKDLATKMRVAAYQYARDNYDIDRVAKQHVDLFKGILNQEN